VEVFKHCNAKAEERRRALTSIASAPIEKHCSTLIPTSGPGRAPDPPLENRTYHPFEKAPKSRGLHHPGVIPLLRREADAGKAKNGRVLIQEAKSGEDPAVLGEVLVRDSEASVSVFSGESLNGPWRFGEDRHEHTSKEPI